MFEHYKDINYDSNVDCYQIREDRISVIFKESPEWVYTYTNETISQSLLDEMKKCARIGDGLNSLISRYCKDPRTFIKTIRY